MRKWTYNEVLLALYAYCHVPFNKANNSNPWIVKIANVIGRSPAAFKMKIGNLGAFDPFLRSQGIVDLLNTSKIDEEVWNDYNGHWDKLAFDAENILSSNGVGLIEDLSDLPVGSDEYYITKRRINQKFFRDSILTSYNNRCCISGISEPSLLEAAHIISWADNESLRTEPTNGLCLNPFFHKAFDKFLITITPDYEIIVSEKLLSSTDDIDTFKYLENLQHSNITMPSRFLPDKKLLTLHYDTFRTNK